MVFMKKKIEFLIKHNRVVQFLYRHTLSFFFRLLGLFVRQNNRLIIFSSFGGRKYNDSPKVIFEAIRDMSEFSSFRLVWAFEKPNDFDIIGAEKVKIDSFKYFLLCLKAKVWITSVNIERGLRFKKRGTFYINTWHGAGTKRIGNGCSGRKDYNFSNIDLMLVQSEFEKQIFIHDFNCKMESIRIVGFPRNDLLFHLEQIDRDAIKDELRIPPNKKVILYAPTWRDSRDGGVTYEVVPPINIDYWKKKLSKDYVVLFRMHAFTTKFEMQYDEFAIDVSKHENLNEILSITDILITDYSTIVYDSAVAGIPFLCFGFDYQQYNEARGFYYDLREGYPYGVIENEKELLDIVLKIKDRTGFNSEFQSFRKKYIQAGGQATEYVIEEIIKHLNLPRSE